MPGRTYSKATLTPTPRVRRVPPFGSPRGNPRAGHRRNPHLVRSEPPRGWTLRVGFISDIHGNLLALEAVLSDLERHEVDSIVCLGDICFGPQAHECLERVRELGCPIILGNWDSWS